MVHIIKQEIDMESNLKNKIEFICSFCNTTSTIYNGSIRIIEHTNLMYVEPHRIIIKGITFLAFNYEPNVYEESLKKSIPLKDLEEYWIGYNKLDKKEKDSGKIKIRKK